MKSINRFLKFQLLSYFKALGIALIVGVAITLLANATLTISLGSESYTFNKMSWAVGFVTILISLVFLIIQCFMCFYEDYRFSTRLGITRRNFFIGNLIFFLIIMVLYSSVFTAIGMRVLSIPLDSKEIIETEMVSDMLDTAEDEIKEDNISREDIIIPFQHKVDEINERGFLYIFKIIFPLLLGIVGFWMLVGFSIFALQAKALLIIVPLFWLLGNLDVSRLKLILFFIFSQIIIGFCINYIEERV